MMRHSLICALYFPRAHSQLGCMPCVLNGNKLLTCELLLQAALEAVLQYNAACRETLAVDDPFMMPALIGISSARCARDVPEICPRWSV